MRLLLDAILQRFIREGRFSVRYPDGRLIS